MATLLQFGLNVPAAVGPGTDPVAAAVRAEALGYDFVSMSDHPGGGQPSYETWTVLAWMAASTSRIRMASRVLGVPYRNPALLAKMAETFDRLSGGRLILGLGGGYSDDEFRAFGLGRWSPGEKVDGLDEAIQIIRGLWSEPSFTLVGRQHRTEAAELAPKPDHHIPIWLGTFGDRALAVTGRRADGWIPSLGLAPPDRAVAMRERILSARREAGLGPAGFTCAYNLEVRVDERAPADPPVVSGSADAIAERLIGFVALGFTAFNFMPVGPDKGNQAELLAAQVIPVVRAAV